MVFVNDLGQSAPWWMHHIQPSNADGMTLADVVFPFFLFIAGVSIPLAFQAAKRRGDTRLKIFSHILLRSFGLILMGLIEVNRSAEIGMGPDRWGLLAFVSIILAWCVVPKKQKTNDQQVERSSLKRNILIALKTIGVLGLVIAFVIYRREPVKTNVLFLGDVESWQWIRTEWWGILGLIGWAYLTSALVCFFAGSRREWLMAAVGLLMLNFLVSQHGGFFTTPIESAGDEAIPRWSIFVWLESAIIFVNKYVYIESQLGSLPAIVMSGCVLGTILKSDSEVSSSKDRIKWALGFSVGLFLAGAMTYTFAGINKIDATPTWCFWCAALATLLWIALYFVMDVKGWQGWSIIVRPAGANPLIAYLLHPILLFILSLTGLGASVRAYAASPSAWTAIGGSLAMALVICALTALIAKLGLRIRI